MKECTSCAYLNPDETNTCINCGEDLPEAAAPTPAPAPEPLNPPMPKPDPFTEDLADSLDEPVQRVSPPPAPEPPRRQTPPPTRRENPPSPPPVRNEPTPPNPPERRPSPPQTVRRLVRRPSGGGERTPNTGPRTMPIGQIHSVGEEEPTGFILVSDSDERSIEFDKNEVSLNRQTLDKGNMSISGREHAKIYYRNGKWYLKDVSSNGATFVQVKGDIPLEDGVRVIFGQKIFRFETKKD